MNTNIGLSYSSNPDGGVTIRLDASQAVIRVPLDHENALRVAAAVLHYAGVTSAVFTDGYLQEQA